jgi:hypothetical protein
LGSVHPEEIKITHWFPTVFSLGTLLLLFVPFFCSSLFTIGIFLLSTYLLAIFGHAFVSEKNFIVAFLSVPSALLQLGGYGLGFLFERIKAYFR